MNKNFLMLAVSSLLLTACLQTVADLRNEPKTQSPPPGEKIFSKNSEKAAPAAAPAPVTKQQKEAVEKLHQDDINKDFRELNGRVEVVENQLNLIKEGEQVKALEAKIVQLETKISLLEATVTDLNSKSKAVVAAPVVKESKSQVGTLGEASHHFDNKKWEDAILAYEEYRKTNPKGKSYPDATYKIGLCFQNLGMKDDARAFFKEVVEKYPQSKEAGLAKSKLKKL